MEKNTKVKVLDLFEYADRLEELGEEELAEKLRNDLDNIIENLQNTINKIKGEKNEYK